MGNLISTKDSGRSKPTAEPIGRQVHSLRVSRLLAASRQGIQTKLRIGQPGDRFEQEADRVAEQVMRMSEPRSMPTDEGAESDSHVSSPRMIQRECTSCRKDDDLLQAKSLTAEAPDATPAVSRGIHSLQGAGQSLPATERHFFEPRFGSDFSAVRIHDGAQAARLAHSVHARAFTFGRHVVFGRGEYAPATTPGRSLLAHELAHVVQQGRGLAAGVQRRCESGATGDCLQTDTGTESDQPKPKCGPDATDWFIRQVTAAQSDSDVLDVKGKLTMANTMLGLASPISAQTLAEAGAVTALSAQEIRLGSSAPARNPTINAQTASGLASASRVTSALPSSSLLISPFGGSILAATLMVGQAALKWKSLVDHGAKFDFKAHVMNHPRTTHCPDDNCVPTEVGVITICPGSASENCYESDLPGNLFYALIGRFVGWSELTLQLGSQLAELTDTRRNAIHPRVTWDSP